MKRRVVLSAIAPLNAVPTVISFVDTAVTFVPEATPDAPNTLIPTVTP